MLTMYACIIALTIAMKKSNRRTGRREQPANRLLEPVR
jgi:hypothetical protein